MPHEELAHCLGMSSLGLDASRIKTSCLVAHKRHPSSLRTEPADLRTLANTSKSTVSPLAFSEELILLDLKQQIFDPHASASLNVGGRLETCLCIPEELTVVFATAEHIFAFSSPHGPSSHHPSLHLQHGAIPAGCQRLRRCLLKFVMQHD